MTVILINSLDCISSTADKGNIVDVCSGEFAALEGATDSGALIGDAGVAWREGCTRTSDRKTNYLSGRYERTLRFSEGGSSPGSMTLGRSLLENNGKYFAKANKDNPPIATPAINTNRMVMVTKKLLVRARR